MFFTLYGVLMKKFFTLITLISALVPALHGMDTNLPADVQKKYDHLVTLIQNADVEAFKPAFDAITLPAESIASLRQTVAETKATITKELEIMDGKTKSWSKLTKGGLTTVGGFVALVSGTAALIYLLNYVKINNRTIEDYAIPLAIPAVIPAFLFDRYIKNSNATIDFRMLAATSAVYLAAAYKGIPYGIKTFKAGLNYKEHLQNMLINLDEIDAYITQAKA